MTTKEVMNLDCREEENKEIIFDGQRSSQLFDIYSTSLTLRNIKITNISNYGAIYAYNSNIKGAKNAIDVLSEFKDRKRILITPGIVDLGEKLGKKKMVI